MTGDEFVNITTQTTTSIFSKRGVLRRIVINEPLAGGVITIYNNTAGSGTKVGTITCAVTNSDTPISLEYDAVCGIGCTIVTSGANQDITVVWSQE